MSAVSTQIYKELTGRTPREVLAEDKEPPGVLRFTAQLWEENYLALFHTLLEDVASQPSDDPWMATAENSLNWLHEEFQNLKTDTRQKLEELSILWKERLQFEVLYPYLQNIWVEQREGLYYLKGNGSREESRKLYQQTVQDLVSEGARILSLEVGRLVRIEKVASHHWQKESLHTERAKVIPVLEEGIRKKASQIFREVPDHFNLLYRELFMRRVRKWDRLGYSSERELFYNIASHWASGRVPNGFLGFLEFLIASLRDVLEKMHDLHYRKWRLFLRGLGN